MKYLSSLISILWSRTWPYLAGFATFGAILWVIGVIAILCGMPIVGLDPRMGNAIFHVPEFDNGLVVIMVIAIPIVLVVAAIAACRHVWAEIAEFFREVKRKANGESEYRGKFKTEWSNPPDTRTPEQRMIDADIHSFDGNPN